MTSTLFVADGIEKAFGQTKVLRGVTLDVREGEMHALLGENGAGKSTLMRIVLGLAQPDAGSMSLSGVPYRPRSAAEARAAGVVMVPQERTLCRSLTVEENIVLGIEPTNAAGLLRERSARDVAERSLALVTGEAGRIAPGARAASLSVADQQLVEIARALVQGGMLADPGSAASRAKLLVLDEPTSSLGHDDAVRLFERIRALRETGLSVVLVTHFLSDVRDHADRYTVLRDGRMLGSGDPRKTSLEAIVHEMVGRELGAALDETKPRAESTAREPLLAVSEVAGRDKPERASFSVSRGEIVGIAGVVGSGRTELLRVAAGLDPVRKGTIERRGPRGVGLLSEDRGGEGLMLERSISDNVALTPRGPFFVGPSREEASAAERIRELAIRAAGPTQRVWELSGGNQQKVQIARLLREDYDVLLFDEPTRGIDVASKAQVLALLRELASGGKAIVLVSSQFEELLAVCDRVAVLKRGVLGDFRPTAEWSEASLLLEAAS